MSIQHHRHARRQLDVFVRSGYHCLLFSTAPARRMYTRLLESVRENSTLLTPIGDTALLERAVGALIALARYHARYEAMPETWAGGEGNIYALVQSLAEHLLGRFPVPRCLAMVWLEPVSAPVKQAHEWFIAHSQGGRFRAIEGLPIAMTRKMEKIWIHSPHHLSVRQAMRRAELLALGATPALVEAVLATDIGDKLEHGEFWREVMHWLVNHHAELDDQDVAEIIEYIDGQRFSPTRISSPDGCYDEPPPEPDFSLAGRTVESLMRRVEARRRELDLLRRGDLSWMPTGLAGFVFRESPNTDTDTDTNQVEWQIIELLDSQQLRAEGNALHHCVGIYSRDCASGSTSIWSMRRRTIGTRLARRYTIEVEPQSRRIVQVRGHCNSSPREHVQRIIDHWAKVAHLRRSD